MKIIETPLSGLLILEPQVFEDTRGYFFESYQQQRYIDAGIESHFIQDNESKSGRGVVRGLHYQLDPFAQAKLVRVVQELFTTSPLICEKDHQLLGNGMGWN